MILSQPQLGFSITSPFKAVAHGVESGAKGTYHVAKSVAKKGVLLATLPVVELNKIVLTPILHAALTPVRHKVGTLKDRRARKLAWDRRRSSTPSTAERNEAKSWTKSKLRGQVPPLGLMLSLLAGPPQMGAFGDAGDYDMRIALGDPATASVLASVPAMLALMNTILSRSSKNGEAPAAIKKGAATAQQALQALNPGSNGGGAAAATDDGSGGDASAAAADDGSATDSGGGGGKHGGGAMITLPGLGPVKKSYVIIGGVVLGGVILLSLLGHKS